MAHRPNPAPCLFLPGLQVEKGFYGSKQLGGKKSKEELYFVTQENYVKFKFLCP